MADPRIETAATALLGAWRTMRQLDGLPEACRPRDEAEAYGVQARVVERLVGWRGGTVIGYKIGATTEAAQRILSVAGPFHGRLLSAHSFASPARLQGDGFHLRVIEPELGFRMGRALPARAEPYTAEDVARAAAELVPAIEIVDCRMTEWTTRGGLQLIADSAANGAWVHGAPVGDWQGRDLAAVACRLTIDGELKGEGTGAAVLGNPLNALAWLANALSRAGSGLKAGDYVTTGTLCAPPQAGPNARIEADFGDLGTVRVSFA